MITRRSSNDTSLFLFIRKAGNHCISTTKLKAIYWLAVFTLNPNIIM